MRRRLLPALLLAGFLVTLASPALAACWDVGTPHNYTTTYYCNNTYCALYGGPNDPDKIKETWKQDWECSDGSSGTTTYTSYHCDAVWQCGMSW